MLNMKKIYLLIGGPGSGKTSTMEALDKKNIAHFSIGAEYRNLVNQGSELGEVVKNYIDKGQVVPIQIAQKVIENFIEKGNEVIVIDGYPRNMEQLHMLNDAIENKAELCIVIELIVEEEVALERITQRARGVDDDPAMFKERIRVYEAEIEEIRNYYKSQKKYVVVNSNNDINTTAEKLRDILFA